MSEMHKISITMPLSASYFSAGKPKEMSYKEETKALLHHEFYRERQLFFYLLMIDDLRESNGSILLKCNDQSLVGYEPFVPDLRKEFDMMIENLFQVELINFYERKDEEIFILIDRNKKLDYREIEKLIYQKKLESYSEWLERMRAARS